ncbi:MAG TPA: hypothetical protein VH501_02770 [Solirubrobacterales bacterium]
MEVRSALEILSTLDGQGSLEGMPFMPEMAAHVGRRYTVGRRVDKICNTIDKTGSRRLYDTVYLEDLRCDGSAHGGCQAGCRIYWKEAWLRRVDDHSAAAEPDDEGVSELERRTGYGTRTVREIDGEQVEVWRCQSTDALEFSVRLKTSNLAQYWRELRNGNYGPFRYVRLLLRGFLMEVAGRVGLLKAMPLHGPGAAPPAELGLQRGDLVQVRDPEEIESTLDDKGFNRGLSFDREMLPYCGRTVRVKDTVDKIIDEKTGKMLKIPKDSLILEGAVCSGERTPGCWFCPREIYPFWREAWVRPVEGSDRPDVTA